MIKINYLNFINKNISPQKNTHNIFGHLYAENKISFNNYPIKKKIFVILIILTAVSVNAQWTTYQTNTSMDLYKIQFVNANTGFVSGGESSEGAGFFKTTDAGLNWQRYIMTDTISWNWETIYGMFFVNANTGYVSGRYLRVFKTTNGGLNWTSSVPPYFSLTQIYNALYFINENTGFAAGRYGYFCKTTDGGNNWTLLNILNSALFCVNFINESYGFVGDGAGNIYKTTNGGINFTQQALGYFEVENLYFGNISTGYLTAWNGGYGAIYKTINSGVNWYKVYEGNKEIYDVKFVNSSMGFASGNQAFLKTTNLGENWISYSTQFKGLSLDFIDLNTGFISSKLGKIYKTSTGGVGINQISTNIPSMYSLSQNSPNPFNPSTKIRFDVGNGFPVKTSGNDKGGNLVLLKVYDVMGREVQTLVNESLKPGTYEVTFNVESATEHRRAFGSAVYFYKLISDGFSKTKKMLLIK